MASWNVILLFNYPQLRYLGLVILISLVATLPNNFRSRLSNEDLSWSLYANYLTEKKPVVIPINPRGWVINISSYKN